MDDTADMREAASALEEVRARLEEVLRITRELDRVIGRPMETLAVRTSVSAGEFQKLNDQMRSFKDSLARDFGKAITGAIKDGDGFIGFFDRLRGSLEDLVIQLAVVNSALNVLFGGSRGELSAIGGLGASGRNDGLLGDLTSGILGLFEARAFGGPVNAGQPYLVGERGPELFMPQTAGRINPTIGGGGGVNITMNVTTPDVSSFRASQAQIAASMMDAARRAQRIR